MKTIRNSGLVALLCTLVIVFGLAPAALAQLPKPTITSISPAGGPTTGGTSVTITGTGFSGATDVRFGAASATNITVVSGTSISANSAAGSGVVDVTVTTPVNTSDPSPADHFTYTIPAPSVTGISPVGGSTAGGTVVTLTGINFTGATAVTFGGAGATDVTVVTATSITATSPAGSGVVDVTVTTSGGTSVTSPADQFTYAVPAPSVTGISPPGSSSLGGTSVTVTGTDFTGATAVMFGGAGATDVTVVTATSITATSPAGSGVVDVTVTTPGGTSVTSPADQFTYVVVSGPAVTGITPSFGPLAGGSTVTLTGSGFTGATAVAFGTTAATGFTVVSDTSITATSPAGSGKVDVLVTNGSGTSAPAAAEFTYATLTITADNQTKVFGAALPELTASYTGFLNGETPASLASPPTCTTAADPSSDVAASPYPVDCSGAVDPNYTIDYAPGSLTVTPAALTVTADNQSKMFGAAVPALTASYTGFVNGDTAGSLTTPPTLTTTATATSPASGNPYPVTASGAVAPNYAISYVAGSLTVTAATLTITANDQTKAYGAAVPELTVSYAGFVNGDTAASLTVQPTLTTTATAASAVVGGPYEISASGAVDPDYAISYEAGSLSVTPVGLTVSADNVTKSYGNAVPELTASYAGFVNGDTSASLSAPPVLSTPVTAASDVSGSPYPVTAGGAFDANYVISYLDGFLTVTPAPLTITANTQSKMFGTALPALTASYAGFVNGDTSASLTIQPVLSTTATAGSPVSGSPYAIDANGAVDANYAISYVAGGLIVTAATLTITADDQLKVYGSALPALSASYAGFVNGDTSASLTIQPVLSTTATAGSPVSGSPYAIDAGGAVADNYAISYVEGSLTVTAAPLTITANDQSSVYGSALPALTASYSGFVNGDTTGSLATAPVLSTTATAGSSVSGSPYAIDANGAVDANYAISYVEGSLTVTAAPLTITANDQSSVYGSALPALTASYSGFVNGDTTGSLATAPVLSTTATAGSSVDGSPYAIDAGGAVADNYAISYVEGSLTVTAAPLTITANDQSSVYGSALPALTASYSGFVNGDTTGSLATAPVLSTTATAGSSVDGSPYAIDAGGAVADNYAISYVEGSLTVTAAPLTITANDQSSVYGSALPALTASYSGFVNGDTTGSLATAPVLSTTATAGSSVDGSPYAIDAGGAVADNYAISYVEGSLTVTAAPLTITADDQAKTFGAALPALTASYAGFVNGDTATSLATAPVLSTTATAASDVAGSPYSVTASGAVDDNYSISYVAGSLTVTNATLIVTANDQSKVYGSALPALTASYSGFVNGDTAASLTVQPTLSTTATVASSVAGSLYVVNASGAVDSDYAISYVPGFLDVTPAGLTVIADDQAKAYGAALPALTASYAGFVNGDTSASLTTPPELSTSASAASHVSGDPYPVTASGAADSNYEISYVPGVLTVTTAPLTITADDQSKVYGAALPALTASYAGFVNGDTSASLTTPPTLTTTATAASDVSGDPYPVTASGAVDADYAISYVDGSLTVTPAALIVTLDNQTKAYGDPLPALTASYAGFVNGDTSASLPMPPTLSTTATAGSSVAGSPYLIDASGAVDANYEISYVAGNLTITAAPLTITADNQSKSFGSPLPSLTASYAGFVNGDTSGSLTTPPVLSTTATAASGVAGSPYVVTAGGAVDPDYEFSYVDGSLTVTTAQLTITANDQAKSFGAALPGLTASYAGFVNGDTSASLTTPPVLSTTATAASGVAGSPYVVTAGGAVDPDYEFSYVDGSLTVTAAVLTVTADDQSKVYGSALPGLTASYAGFVNGDTSASLTTPPVLSTTATAASGVAGSPYAVTASGAVDSNYSFSYVAGTLSVTPAGLTVTADDVSKVYGSALPGLTASFAGFVNGDTSASLTTPPVLSTTATAASGVAGSPYAVTASGAVDSNYGISYAAGTLAVTAAPLTVTADDVSKVYGSALPGLTASFAGFVNGDTSASLSVQPTLSTTATASSSVAASPYAVTASGAVDSNYDISYVIGELAVTAAPLTVTANDQSKVYGSALPGLTASFAGFVNGDTSASLSVQPTLTTTATASSSVAGSPYAVTASGAVDSNYGISYLPGVVVVTPAGLTITADNQTKVFGAALPTLTASYAGLVNGDTPASLTTQPTLTTTATAASSVDGSPYPVTASGAVDSSYTITYVPGALTIVVAAPVPVITAVLPNSGPVAGGTSVRITGSDLSGATAVRFGPKTSSFRLDSPTQITAVAPPGSGGTVDIIITATAGTSVPLLADQYSYVAPSSGGYWLVGSDGGVFTFGDAAFFGSTGATHLNKPIVGMAVTPDGGGYWLVGSDGGVFTFGDAAFFGSTGATHLNKPIVGMAVTPDGGGYWLVGSDGGVFTFGDAAFFGSTGATHLNKPIVGMAVTPDGGGYWLVGSDGGVFTFGDAAYHGSTGATVLTKPIVGMAADPVTGGYWLAGSDGGIFAFGAPFAGSTGGSTLNQTVVGMTPSPTGSGYWLAGSAGAVFAFGDAPLLGAPSSLNQPLVGMAGD